MHRAADDAGLGRVGHPAGARDQQVAVVGQLQHEQQLLGTRADQHVLPGTAHALAAVDVASDGFAQAFQTFDWKIVFFVGVLLERIDHAIRHRERRLPQPQFDDVLAFGAELVAELIDAQGGGGLDAPYVQVNRVTVVVFDVHCPGLLVGG